MEVDKLLSHPHNVGRELGSKSTALDMHEDISAAEEKVEELGRRQKSEIPRPCTH